MSVPPEVQELQRLVADRQAPPCLPVGSKTKSALVAGRVDQAGVRRLPLKSISGITAYTASEFLITARAGTPLQQICDALEENQQYLPFDPLLVHQGATLGGTVASGLSGPNCMLSGGLRDFVMEVELIDGLGELVRGGGKVVKNAAGFDLPKLVVGSYGRLGVLTEVTLKVLPRPAAYVTVMVDVRSPLQGVQSIQNLLGQPLPMCALEIDPQLRLLARFAAPQASLADIVNRAQALLSGSCAVEYDDHSFWSQAAGLETAATSTRGDALLLRVAMDITRLDAVMQLIQEHPGVRLQTCSHAGSVAWLIADDQPAAQALDAPLAQLDCSAIAVFGRVDDLFALGKSQWRGPALRIQRALDPHQRFLSF